MVRRAFVQSAVAGLMLAGVMPMAAMAQTQAHKIAPGDEVTIKVLGEDEYSIVATVRGDGKITYPYSGDIEVAGLTAPELREKILAIVRKELKRPEVLVSVRELPPPQVSIIVIGAARNQGKVAIKEGSRLIDVIGTIGVINQDRPEWVTCTLLRNGMPKKIDLVKLLGQLDLTENDVLLDGDILWFQELDIAKTHIQVLGEVQKPGPMPLPTDPGDLSVLDAAGGATPKAQLSKAMILRAGQQIPVNLSTIATAGTVAPVQLQPGDTLFLPPLKAQFMVSGAVGKPGLQDYPDKETTLNVVEALQLAGNVVQGADLKKAQLVRQKPGSDKPDVVTVDLEQVLQKGNQKLNVAVEPGDLLFIPSKRGGNRFDPNSIFILLQA
ncbi:MAG: polysaccharide biosynthesis/export family protein, partial [Armatimonadota bacterium]